MVKKRQVRSSKKKAPAKVSSEEKSSKEKINADKDMMLEHASEKIEKRFKKKIQLHTFTEQEFEKLKKSKNLLVEEIVRDGIRVV